MLFFSHVFVYTLFSCSVDEQFTPPPAKKEEKIEEPVEEIEEEINVAPVIRALTFSSPEHPTTKDSIRVEVDAFDAEDERIRYQYTWTLNGEVISTEGRAVFPSHRHKKGDEILVEVLASDGTSESAPASLSVRIENASPYWVSDPREVRQIHGYKVQAEDPDNDSITYSLENAPQGMSIDPIKGVLSYKGSTDAKRGKYDIQVKASDPEGAFVQWRFSITVQ